MKKFLTIALLLAVAAEASALDRSPRTQGGKDLFRPRHRGSTHDGPLIAVFHGVAVGLGDAVAVLPHLLHLFLIDSSHSIGIFGQNINHTRELIQALLHPLLFPSRHIRQGGYRLVTAGQPFDRRTLPVHLNMGRAGPITFLNYSLNQIGLIHCRTNDHPLALLHVGAHSNGQASIFLKQRFFHIHHHALKEAFLSFYYYRTSPNKLQCFPI